MESGSVPTTKYHFLQGGGEAGALIRTMDWSATALGAPDAWPGVLRHAVRFMLDATIPMYVAWGADFTMIYNDGYIPTLGTVRHPRTMGIPLRESSESVWERVKPLFAQVMQGEKVGRKDFKVTLDKNGELEECWFDLSYIPIHLDDGTIGGLQAVFIETTEKMRGIKSLEDSKNQLAFAIDATELGVWDLNPATGKFIANDRLKYWFGLEEDDEVPLQHAIDVMAPQDRERVSNAIQHALLPESGGQYDIDYCIINPVSGQERIVRAKGRAQFEDGMAYRFNGTLQDITDRKKAIQSIEENEERLRSVIEAAPAAMGLFVGRDLVVQNPNQAFIDIVGKGSDIVGKPLREVMPELLTEDQPFLRILDNVYTSGKMFQSFGSQVKIVQQGVMTDNYYNITYTPVFNDKGEVWAILDIAIDVTGEVLARQQLEISEARFQNLIREATVGIVILMGEEMRIEIVNDAYGQLINRSAADLLGKNLFNIIPEGAEQFLHLLNGVRTTGVPVYLYGEPYSVWDEERNEISGFLNIVYQPYRELDGSITGVMVLCQDVTAQVSARKEIEEVVDMRTRELADVNKTLYQSNSELAQFAYITSHDLQEPLRKISIFADMLQKHLSTGLDDKTQFYLDKITGSSARMLTLIKDVLSFAQLSKERKQMSPVSLADVLQTAISDFEVLIADKEAVVSGHDLPTLAAIPLQMAQLFNNLISNALKYTTPGVPPIVMVKSVMLTEEEVKVYPALNPDVQYYDIQFTDNGIGFPPEHAEQIFNIFQRLHARHEYAGTGIGLAMCRKIADNHYGLIYATSIPGSGSTFHVILPA